MMCYFYPFTMFADDQISSGMKTGSSSGWSPARRCGRHQIPSAPLTGTVRIPGLWIYIIRRSSHYHSSLNPPYDTVVQRYHILDSHAFPDMPSNILLRSVHAHWSETHLNWSTHNSTLAGHIYDTSYIGYCIYPPCILSLHWCMLRSRYS